MDAINGRLNSGNVLNIEILGQEKSLLKNLPGEPE